MTQQTDIRAGGASLRPTASDTVAPSPHDTSVLDNAVWAALDGPHAHLAERVGRAARYPDDVYAFAALADPRDPAAWADLHTLVGPGTTVRIKPVETVPDGWEVVGAGEGVQHRLRDRAVQLPVSRLLFGAQVDHRRDTARGAGCGHGRGLLRSGGAGPAGKDLRRPGTMAGPVGSKGRRGEGRGRRSRR